MDSLPPDIIRLLFAILNIDAINFALTCKWVYTIYKNNRHPLIAKRFERVANKYNECKDGAFGVVFDRMYNLYPYHESTIQMMFVKVYYPAYFKLDNGKQINLEVWLHYTCDKWQNVKREEFRVIDFNKYGDVVESDWLMADDFCWEKFDEMWFAIELIDKTCGRSMWDNNGGWNYDTSKEHHWIPDWPVFEKYPLTGFLYGGYVNAEYVDLNEWLYN